MPRSAPPDDTSHQLSCGAVVGDILQPTHLLFILVVALLVLGPKRLPEVGRALGRGLRDFRSAISGEERSEPAITQPSDPVLPVTPPHEPTDHADQTIDAEPQTAGPPQTTEPAHTDEATVVADATTVPKANDAPPSTNPSEPVDAVASATGRSADS